MPEVVVGLKRRDEGGCRAPVAFVVLFNEDGVFELFALGLIARKVVGEDFEAVLKVLLVRGKPVGFGSKRLGEPCLQSRAGALEDFLDDERLRRAQPRALGK